MTSLNIVKDEKRIFYEDISSQIIREENLVNNRLRWILQINGFLFGALALEKCNLKTIHLVISFLGLVISVSGLIGVCATWLQTNYLLGEFDKNCDKRWPRPFGKKKVHNIGWISTIIPPIMLSLAWGYLIYFYIIK